MEETIDEIIFQTAERTEHTLTYYPGLYTDESPGLKVDPVVVMTLSVVFIFSVVALHGMFQNKKVLIGN